jgi:hypothetical protein
LPWQTEQFPSPRKSQSGQAWAVILHLPNSAGDSDLVSDDGRDKTHMEEAEARRHVVILTAVYVDDCRSFSARIFLPYAAQFPIDLVHIKFLGVKRVADPFRELFVLRMGRITDSL